MGASFSKNIFSLCNFEKNKSNKSIISPEKYTEKNMEIKYSDGSRFFVTCDDGSLIEYSLIEKKTVYDFGRILVDISSVAKTPDNKS